MPKDIYSYNPDIGPDKEAWLAIDESERISLISAYHRKERIELPNLHAHAMFHAIVENQLAMKDQIPVHSVFERIMKEGLDRHDAVHAIASVLASYMYNLAKKNKSPSANPNEDYWAELKKLTAESWRNSG